MYAVTGATGQFGRLAIASLFRRVGAGEIIALARDPAKAVDLEELGITVRAFDYDAPDGLEASLDGVTRLLLVSSDMPDRRVAQHKAVIDAAVGAAVDVIAYTSIIHADTNPISLAESHRETERMIAVSGLSHAILRNSWYIENYLIGADAAIAQGALLGSSGTGMISAATRADYADAAAAVLTQVPGDNPVYELAGDEAFTLYDVASVLSEVAGRTVVYRDLPEPAYRAALIDAGMPAGLAAALAEYSAKAAGDILADRSRTLSRLIGRPVETMRDTVLRTLVRPATADNT
jgi:NAD(P)H dehydrogenase (quinone)